MKKREFIKRTKDLDFGSQDRPNPCCKVFGQMIAFPCSSPRQFWRACVIVAKLGGMSNRVTKKLEKLEAQLKQINELSDQLWRDRTTS